MCGIAGVYLKNPDFVKQHEGLETFVNALYLGIEPRGRRATGLVAVLPGGKVGSFEKADVSASDFIEVRDPLPEGTRCVLLHTRLDTKGSPKNNLNNHPVLSGTTFVTHNGSVHNDDELFKEHELTRKAEVDSEAIAAMIEKYGLDKAAFSLEKIRGNIAIAAIDPTRHPDRLVLAKGQNMPIEVIENNNFIVWASTRKAIEEAWGLVLGTPPKYNKYHTFKAGEIWVVEGNTVEKQEYKVDYSYRTRTNTNKDDDKTGGATKSRCDDGGDSSCGVDVGWGNGWPLHSEYRSRETKREEPYARAAHSMNQPTTRDFREAIAKRKADGKPMYARVMGECSEEDLRGISVATYTRCSGCTRSVLREDMRPTFQWGRMCEDCYTCAIGVQQERYDNPAADLNDNDRLVLNNWVKVEAMIHRKTLNLMAEKVELDPDIIEWLIFRVPKPYIDGSKKMNDLAADLDDMYQEKSAELFKQHGIGDASNPETAKSLSTSNELVRREESRGNPMILCRKHNHWYPTARPACFKCVVESREEQRSSASPFVAGPPPSVQSHGKTILPCRTCKPKRRQPGKFRLGRFVFCGKHWLICGNPDCLLADLPPNERKEGYRAVATSPDGTRLCHFCSRSTPGLLADGNLEDRGITIEQL